MMNHPLPSVSIFIPSYNDQVDLSACLESICHLNYPKEKIEIVIWDNASMDDTVRMVKERFDEMKDNGWLGLSLIQNDKNEGSYIPYNLAFPKFSKQSQYILGLDADVELSGDIINILVSTVQSENAAVVGARSVFYSTPEVTAHGAGYVNRWTALYGEKDSCEPIKCDYVIGCCFLLQKNIFEQLAGFDSDYYICHWEVDYCLRAINRGFSVIYEPRAVVKHKIFPGGTITKERLYYLYRNRILLIKKIFPLPHRFTALTLHLLLGIPKNILLSIIRNKGVNYNELRFMCKAFIDGCLNRSGKII